MDSLSFQTFQPPPRDCWLNSLILRACQFFLRNGWLNLVRWAYLSSACCWSANSPGVIFSVLLRSTSLLVSLTSFSHFPPADDTEPHLRCSPLSPPLAGVLSVIFSSALLCPPYATGVFLSLPHGPFALPSLLFRVRIERKPKGRLGLLSKFTILSKGPSLPLLRPTFCSLLTGCTRMFFGLKESGGM